MKYVQHQELKRLLIYVVVTAVSLSGMDITFIGNEVEGKEWAHKQLGSKLLRDDNYPINDQSICLLVQIMWTPCCLPRLYGAHMIWTISLYLTQISFVLDTDFTLIMHWVVIFPWELLSCCSWIGLGNYILNIVGG